LITAEALAYLVETLGEDLVRELAVDGKSYITQTGGAKAVIPPPEPTATKLEVSTLSSLADYLTENIDGLERSTLVIHVVDPVTVDLLTAIEGRHRQREHLIRATAHPPKFPFGQFLEAEAFVIGLQSCFLADTGDQAALLRLTKLVKKGSEVQQADDGRTQRITVEHGISLKSEETLPNPVRLAPYRSFSEIVPVTSAFVLRAKEGGMGGVALALFEADGGAWRNDTVERVGNKIMELLGDVEVSILW
jgi:hypothetical protein